MREQYLIAFMLLSCLNIFQAQSGIKIEHLSQKDGLSYRWAHHITQDKNDFLWIATEKDINRYDGYEFKTFPIQIDNTPIEGIKSLQESEDGNIWITYQDTTVCVWHPYRNEVHLAKKGKDFFIPRKRSYQTINWNFAKFLPELKTINTNLPKELNPENSQKKKTYNILLSGFKSYGTQTVITRKPQETLWFWYNWNSRGHTVKQDAYHYVRLNIVENRWETFTISEFLKVQIVNPLLPIDVTGRFWFPSFEKATSQPFDYFQLPLEIDYKDWIGIRLDNRQNIWIYNKNFELYRYDINSQVLEAMGKIPNQRIEIYEDKEGTIWITTENGLKKISRSKHLFQTYLSKPFILGDPPPIGISTTFIAEAKDGQVYVKNNSKDLLIIDLDTKQIRKKTAYYRDYIMNLDVFYANNSPSFRKHFDLKTNLGTLLTYNDQTVPFPKNTTALQPYISPRRSRLLVWDTLRNSIEWPEEFSKYLFGNAYWDQPNQRLWAFNKGSILKLDWTDFSIEKFPIFDQEDPQFVRAWMPDGDSLWIATVEGLKLLDLKSNQIVKQYTTEDGLPHDIIYSIIKTENTLWLGTHNGLCCFKPKTGDIRNFYVEDGLSHNEFNTHSALLHSNGTIWMGGLNGINVFDPKVLENIERDSAKLQITQFSKYNPKEDSTYTFSKPHLLDRESFTINPNDQSFHFQFMLSSFTNPSKNRYFWYLEGYEPIWAHVDDEPLATYQNVPSGKYILKIRAIDFRGNPAAKELKININVLQFWYLRWWAWCLYILILGIAILGVYRFQLRRKLAEEEASRLKELDSLKTKLYTNITHEFRTPLTVILGMTEQLVANKPKEEGKLRMIQRNGQNLLNLINQMLDLSKLESGQMQLKLERDDIVAYVKYLIESFHSLANSKDIQLSFFSQLDAFEMPFDKEKLLQIVSNLISNAIKFTPKSGTVEVMLEMSYSTKTPNGIILIIKDSGIGIMESKLPHIFERFYQADNSTTRTGEGTGIGLALVKELVQLMDGNIQAESVLNRGTCFKIQLPILKSKGNAVINAVQAHPKVPTFSNPLPATSTTNLTEDSPLPILLIIEDHQDVAHYIQTCLEDSYQIVHAKNGAIGIENALELIPDLIISDVMMPLKDGFEVVQTLKSDERSSHIPIILLTAKADVASRLEGLERGADAYLAKPFHPPELQLRVKKLIELRSILQKRYANIGNLEELEKEVGSTQIEKELVQTEDAFILKINDILQKNLSDSEFGVQELTRQLGSSRSQVFRKLKALTGKSIALYIRSYRLHQAKILLQKGALTVSEVAYEVGYTNLSYFSRSFVEEFGFSPKTLKINKKN